MTLDDCCLPWQGKSDSGRTLFRKAWGVQQSPPPTLFEKERAINARKLEMELVKRTEVRTKVDRSVAEMLGAKVIATK